MKNFFIQLFEIEEGEFELKDFVSAGIALTVSVGFIVSPLFM